MLLNPSTADDRHDDPTVRRCRGLAREWRFGSFALVNLFAIRATDPRALRRARDPIGAGNDRAIVAEARDADAIVIGWGSWGRVFAARSLAVRALLAPYADRVFVIGSTRSGEPRHPLYVPRGTALRRER